MAQVTIGGQPRAVEPITGYKAIRGGRLISKASAVLPEAFRALADFRREYAESNAIIVTPALAKLPRFQREIIADDGTVSYEAVWTDQDFAEAGGEIKLPADPSGMEQVLAVLPVVWDTAERPVVELVTLLLSPNAELKLADKTGQIDEYLAERSVELLHELAFDEIAGIIEVLGTMLGSALGGDAAGEAVTRTAEAMGVTPPPTSTTNSQTLSGSSQNGPDGGVEPSSTEPLIENSSA
jgi:hypothetical protein